MTRRVPLSRQYHGTHWETNWGNQPQLVPIDPLYRLQANLNPSLHDKISCRQLVYRRCEPMKPNQTITWRPLRGYNPCTETNDPCDAACCDNELNILVFGDEDYTPTRRY